jgi:transcriptional regulator with XRE-family HTH domain
MRRTKSLPELLELDLIRRQETFRDQARRFGVDRSTLWDWRQGKRPSPRMVGRIAEVLEIDLEELLDALPAKEVSA